MKLSILYLPNLNRPWLLKREHGKYEQHAHFYTEKAANQCRTLIDAMKYPYNKDFLIAMRRILTDQEMNRLRRKQHYKNINKGAMNYR